MSVPWVTTTPAAPASIAAQAPACTSATSPSRRSADGTIRIVRTLTSATALSAGMLRTSSSPLTLMVAPAPDRAELAIVPPRASTATEGSTLTPAGP